MRTDRRRLLLVAGRVATLGAAGTLTGCSSAAVYGPWTGPEADLRDPRLRAATWGLLAPSPHNAQPWRLRLVGSDELELHVDPDRCLLETDPVLRQVYVGHGAFLEQLALGAQLEGARAEIETLPEGEALEQPVARIRVSPAAGEVDPLAGALEHRQTNKRPYAPGPVPEAARVALRAEGRAAVDVRLHTDPDVRAFIQGLAVEATRIEVSSPRAARPAGPHHPDAGPRRARRARPEGGAAAAVRALGGLTPVRGTRRCSAPRSGSPARGR